LQNISGQDLVENPAKRGKVLAFCHRLVKRQQIGANTADRPYIVEGLYATFDGKLVKATAFDQALTGGGSDPHHLVRF
jgi:hypothetical protein